MKMRAAALLSLAIFANADAGHIYSYHENGANWGKKWPLCDHGKE
jgi:hypothetical protein